MAKQKNKTQATSKSVDSFLASISDEQKKKDSIKLLDIMKKITGENPVMWGGSIIGFGSYHYIYDSGREGDFMKTGFSPRKNNLSIYIMTGFEKFKEKLSRLGKYKTGKSCLYIKNLEECNQDILEEIISDSYTLMTKKYG